MDDVPAAEPVDRLTEQLRADLASIWVQVTAAEAALLTIWPRLTASARRRRLNWFERDLQRLTGAAEAFARLTVPTVIAEAGRLGAIGTALATGSETLAVVDMTALTQMTADTYGDVLKATTHMRETAKDLVRTLARDHIADRLQAGETSTTAARRLEQSLTDHRISAVIYKDGSRHGLADYTDMLIRTKTAEARQVGAAAQARALNVTYMEIMDGPGCGWTSHQDSRKANGLILPIDEASQYLLSHPRCRRVMTPRADVVTKADAAVAVPVGPQYTPQELEDAAVQEARARQSPAARRSAARTAARNADGTLTPEAGVSAAQRRNHARLRRRAS